MSTKGIKGRRLYKTEKCKTGKPPKYTSQKQLQGKIDEYFNGGCKMRKIVINKKEYEVPNPTITGLCLFLGFCDRTSFYDMEKRPEFAYIIKRARMMIENEYEELLKTTTVTGAIFALKNMQWSDRQEIDQNINISGDAIKIEFDNKELNEQTDND
jgi:hypothetical protein